MGVRALARSYPDLVVVDARLPDGPATRVLAAIRSADDEGTRIDPETPAVVMVDGDDPFERVRALDRGADDAVAAPPHYPEFAARIRALLRRAGVAGVSFDFGLLTERDEEPLGEAVEAGTKLFAGVVPSTDTALSDPGGSVMGVRTLWRRLGLNPGTLAESVVVTPTCGLAGASPAYARAALAHCARAARSLADNPE